MGKHIIFIFFILLSLCLQSEDVKQTGESKPYETKYLKIFKLAKEKALKDKKPMMVVFSGTTWCGPCQAFEKNIFLTKEFAEFADKEMILVLIDHLESGESVEPENSGLLNEFAIEGFPTLILLDEKGFPFQLLSFEDQPVKNFIDSVKDSFKRKDMLSSFLATKDENEKKKIADEFLKKRNNGENDTYYSEMIAFSVLRNNELTPENKINLLSNAFMSATKVEFVDYLKLEIKKIDPEKKFGSGRLFAIKDLLTHIMAQNDEKAFEVFLNNKSQFKGEDLGYLYEFATYLFQQNKKDKSLELIGFILKDQEIAKNPEAVKMLEAQMESIKADLNNGDAGIKAEDGKEKGAETTEKTTEKK